MCVRSESGIGTLYAQHEHASREGASRQRSRRCTRSSPAATASSVTTAPGRHVHAVRGRTPSSQPASGRPRHPRRRAAPWRRRCVPGQSGSTTAPPPSTSAFACERTRERYRRERAAAGATSDPRGTPVASAAPPDAPTDRCKRTPRRGRDGAAPRRAAGIRRVVRERRAAARRLGGGCPRIGRDRTPARGRPAAGGLHRSTDRPLPLRVLRRRAAPRDRARPALRHRALAGRVRPRPLQGLQRPPRPLGRQPPARRGRPRAPARDARHRPRRPFRGRGADRARAGRRTRRRRTRGARAARGCRAGRARAGRPRRHDDLRRRRHVPARARRCEPARCGRRRALRGQAAAGAIA